MGNPSFLRKIITRVTLLISIVLVLVFSWPLIEENLFPGRQPFESGQALSLPTPSSTSLPPTASPTPPQPETSASKLPLGSAQGLVMAVQEGLYSHLFLFNPSEQNLIRITYGEWNDRDPAFSWDGQYLAFSSDRNGYWDLYLLDIQTGEVIQVTDTPEYDGKPSWSPDNLWLAYETYLDDSLEIAIRPLDNQQAPVRLTNNLAADYAPTWSPLGRHIAFVSTHSGERDIWIADLDQIDNRFSNLSNTSQRSEGDPIWSPDGKTLMWSGTEDGTRSMYTWDISQKDQLAVYLGTGDLAALSPDGTQIAARFDSPNQTYLIVYTVTQGMLLVPPIPISGKIQGITWGNLNLPVPLPQNFQDAAYAQPPALWKPVKTDNANITGNRGRLVPLSEIDAPYAALQQKSIGSFEALRTATSETLGWDYLATLENAFVPLTSPALPSLENSWVYTGRGIAINSVPINAGWMTVVKEDYGSQTYWRIYLRTRLQDGSQGTPLREPIWDFTARYNGDARGYEEGGLEVSNPPTGYWIDFTELAAQFGWERMPAMSSWRNFYPATRLNEFAFTENIEWRSALLEIYPPEMLITPTPVASPTITPTPTLTSTATRRPTRTPWPSATPWPSKTSTPTASPTVTDTPTITPPTTPTPVGR